MSVPVSSPSIDHAVGSAPGAAGHDPVGRAADPPICAPPGGPVPAELALADELGQEVFRLVRLIERTQVQATAGQDPGQDLERAAYLLLGHLAHTGPQRARALADAVHSDPSTVSRQVAALVQHGLVERRADPGDGRASLLAATTRGLALFAEKRHLRNLHTRAMLADWDSGEVRDLVRLLRRFTTDFERYRPVLLGLRERDVPGEGTT
jgi:DNA-binding MarR family transcriptional regulator